ncbi:MAG: flavoprotein [Dethiobacteria bacterium]
MRLKNIQVGFALPVKHFNLETIYGQIAKLVKNGALVYPLLFTEEGDEFTAEFRNAVQRLKELTGQEPTAISDEEAGESDTTFDLLVIAPCPKNIITRLVEARATPKTKNKTLLHLQSERPIILALVANGDSEYLLANISQLMRAKSIFLVPLGPVHTDQNKQVLVTRMDLIFETCLKALEGQQLQPFFWEQHWLPQ